MHHDIATAESRSRASKFKSLVGTPTADTNGGFTSTNDFAFRTQNPFLSKTNNEYSSDLARQQFNFSATSKQQDRSGDRFDSLLTSTQINYQNILPSQLNWGGKHHVLPLVPPNLNASANKDMAVVKSLIQQASYSLQRAKVQNAEF